MDSTVNVFFFSSQKTTTEASAESVSRGFSKEELVARRQKRKQDRRVLKLMRESTWDTSALPSWSTFLFCLLFVLQNASIFHVAIARSMPK